MAAKIKINDEVIVLKGKDRGRHGKVLRVEGERFVVQGVNQVYKNVRANPDRGVEGGIIQREAPIHRSNVALLNPATQKGERVGFKVLEDGRKVRIFRSSGEVVDIK